MSSSAGHHARRYFGRLFTTNTSTSASTSSITRSISSTTTSSMMSSQTDNIMNINMNMSMNRNGNRNRNNHHHNHNLMSIRFKSSLHKKAVQALNKKQFKNTMKKNVNNHNNNNNNKNNINNSNSNSKNNSNVSINSNNTAATQKMNMTVNDDILKENQEETVLNGSIENESIESENESSINSDDTSEILNSKSNEEEMVEPMTEVQQVQPHPSIIHQGHLHEFAPRIVVVGVGGGGGNAVNNMIANQLSGVDFLALNTDAQHLSTILTDNKLQIGSTLTSGLGCGANPDAGRLAAEESKEQISEILSDAHMVFITAGMGGGTGTGAAPVVAELCYNLGILTVGVITKPFRFEGTHRMRLANEGIDRMEKVVDTMIVIPNQNLFAMANDQTSFMDAFGMADNVLLAGVKSITDLMTTPGLINLDFADVQSVMHGMGNAILGTGVSSSSQLTTDADGQVTERAILAAEQALANPLLGDNMDIGTAKGMLVNITGGKDMTLFEVDRAAQCITERIQDESANIIFGSAYDESLDGSIRVSVVATGIEERTIS